MAARLAAAPAALRVRRPAASLPAPRGGQALGCSGGPPCAFSAASSPPRQRRRRAEGRAGGWRDARPLSRVRGPARPPPLPLPAAPQRRVGARRRRHARGPLCTYATSSPPAPPARQAGGAAPPAGGAGPGKQRRAGPCRAVLCRAAPHRPAPCRRPGRSAVLRSCWRGVAGNLRASPCSRRSERVAPACRGAAGDESWAVGPAAAAEQRIGFCQSVGPKITRRSRRQRRHSPK